MRRFLLSASFAVTLCLGAAAPVAALTGSGTWDHLGTNGTSPAGPALNGHVYDMYASSGVLYVGGSFTNAGGIPAGDRLAKWNGATWSAIGSAPIASNGAVFAIAVNAGKVYAGGSFLNAGGDDNADYLAVYDGVSWEPFCRSVSGAAFNLQVNALQVIGSILYVGGTFQDANGDPVADYLVGCNMTTGAMSTTTVPGGLDFTGPVNDLAVTSDGTLYAGGNFGNLDQTGATRIAYFNGTWHALAGTDPAIGIVRSLHANGTDVYIGSDTLNFGGNQLADHLVKWNGSSYSSVGSDTAGTDGYFPASSSIYELTMSGSLLFASGNWQDANGQATGDMIAYYDGTAWRPIGSNGAGNGAMSSNTEALAIFGGQVYAGGGISNGGGDPLADWAASRSLRLPDALIAGPTGNFVGHEVYNTTGAGQAKTISIARGTQKTFNLLISNQGLVPASFTLKGAGTATGYTITYFNTVGGANITTAVKNGTFSTGTLAPGGFYEMKMVVKLSNSAANKGTFKVTATSTTNTPKDTVKGVVNAT